jgi:L-fuculose-phosphate aldolase
MEEVTIPPSYVVKGTETVAKGSDLQARLYTLAPGDVIPWHFHSHVTDWYFCLTGWIRIETRAPHAEERLSPGRTYAIPPRTALASLTEAKALIVGFCCCRASELTTSTRFRNERQGMSNDVAALPTGASARLGELYNAAALASDPGWSDAEKIALACRILAADGHDTIVPGLVSVRTAKPEIYLTLPMGLGFEEVTPSRILTVDKDLNVLLGDGKPPKAVGFLIKMHQLRPDIRCGIHTHAAYTAALSMIGEPLAVAHMDATMFHDDCAYLTEWPGNPVTELEGELISHALGSKRAILLSNHGLATVGTSIEEAAWMALCFERAAKMQIRARSLGSLTLLEPEFARDAHNYMTDPSMVTTQFRRFARRVLRQDPSCLASQVS